MKKVYKVLYPIGFEIHEVANDFPTAIPFVEVEPLNDLKVPQSQFFDFDANKWEEAVTQDYSKKLDLLENLHEGLKNDNAVLKESNEVLTKKTESHDEQITETQMAVAEVFEMVIGGDA